jgi:hypothetical protein
VHLYPIDGAAGPVAPGDTAFSYRDARFATVIAAMYPDPRDTPANVAWVREYHAALSAHSAGGAYVNFMMEEGQERIAATYRDNYRRLIEVKQTYDPANLFHLNQNIKPWRGVHRPAARPPCGRGWPGRFRAPREAATVQVLSRRPRAFRPVLCTLGRPGSAADPLPEETCTHKALSPARRARRPW